MNKKKEAIDLRTDLQDLQISDYLRAWSCQNFSELINNPKKDKFRLSFKKSDAFSCDLNLDKFNDTDFFQLSETSRSNQTVESFKDLMEQNYSSYIRSIKKMYPNFRFNHYSKYSERVRSSISLYSSNITQIRTYNTFDTHITFTNDEYIPSTKLGNIGLGKEYITSKEDFKIKDEILEKNQIEIDKKMKEFDYKVEAIEMELDKILSNSNLLYNYIEKNMSIAKLIDSSVRTLNIKGSVKENINKKYIMNSSKTILIGIRRQNTKRLINQMRNLQKIEYSMNKLFSISKNESECNEISDAIAETKCLIKSIDKFKRLKCIQQSEREIQLLENQSEHKLTEDFSNILRKLFLISIQYDNTTSKSINNNSLNKKHTFDLSYEPQSQYDDYEYNGNGGKIILLSKDEKCKYFLLQLLDVVNIIIKDNLDIFDFIELMEKVFREIVMKLFDLIQRQYSSDQCKLVQVLSSCFKMFYLNYEFIIYLFNLNFGLAKKIFNSLEKSLIEEMNKLITFLTSSLLHEAVLFGDSDQYLFLKDQLVDICSEYFNFMKTDLSVIFKQMDLEFLFVFFEKQRINLANLLDKETWVQINEVSDEYFEMTKTLLSDSTQLSLSLFTLNKQTEKNLTNHEYIFLKENKLRVISFSLNEIEFLYTCLHLSLSFTKSSLPEIAKNVYSIIENLCMKGRKMVMDGNDETKNITDKDISLLCSNIQIIKQIIHSFSLVTNSTKSDSFNHLVNCLNDINSTCKEAMIQLLNGLVEEMINDFNDLDFANYPSLGVKEYNSYIKKFTRMKKLYDTMLYSFDNKDIEEIFHAQFQKCVNDMEKVISSKCRIESDNSLKQ